MKYGKRIYKWTRWSVHRKKEPGSLGPIHCFYLGCFSSWEKGHCSCGPIISKGLGFCHKEREKKASHWHQLHHHEMGPSNTLLLTWLKSLLKVITMLRNHPCSTKASLSHKLGAVAEFVCVFLNLCCARQDPDRVINPYPTLPSKPNHHHLSFTCT